MRYSRQTGFTLLEILIVMSILLIMTSVVVLGFTGADRNTRIKTEAQRVALLIELARSGAIQSNQEWGLFVEDSEYYFAALNPVSGIWDSLEQREFRKRTLPNEIKFRLLQLSKRDQQYDEIFFKADDKDNTEFEMPDVVIFSDGEITAFKMDVRVDQDSAIWLVQSDGLSRVAVEQTPREQ